MYYRNTITTLLALSCLALPALAGTGQEQKKEKKRAVISLSTEDVVPVTVHTPAAPGSTAEPNKPSESTEGKAITPEAGKKTKGDEKEKKPDDPAELEWREKMKTARERLRQVRHELQETELASTELRNSRYEGKLTPNSLNASADAMTRNGHRVTQLRDALIEATRTLDQLTEEGKQKQFHEPSLKPTNEQGETNETYYTSRYAELLDQLVETERRIKLAEYRANDLRGQAAGTAGSISGGKKGGGDNYALYRVQQELDRALIELDLARADLAHARQALEDLKEEARRAGLAPGLFRD